MEEILSRHVSVQYMVLCYFFGGAVGDLFGIEFSPPVEIPTLNSRFGETSEVSWSNDPNIPFTNAPFSWNYLSPNNYNTDDSKNGQIFIPTPDAFYETFKVKQPHKVNKSQDNSQLSGTNIPTKKSHGPHSIEKVPESLTPKPNQDIVSDLIPSDLDINDRSEADIDRTTETSEYETTTDGDGVGGHPPAVIASLLG